MKSIFFVLTYTGSFVSKIVKNYTKKEYAHVSISLDNELKEMYSFGRIYAYYPFFGGFVQEGINIGTFKRFKNTKSAVYEYKVTESQYNNIKKIINNFKQNKNIYGYNYLGLFAAIFNKEFKTTNRFYCSEFVKYVLDESGINNDLPKLVKPMDFLQISNELIYKGILREYEYKN